MGVRIEWADVEDLHLVTEDDEVRDEHGSTLDGGNIGLAAAGVVVEGTPQDVAARLETLLGEVRELLAGPGWQIGREPSPSVWDREDRDGTTHPEAPRG